MAMPEIDMIAVAVGVVAVVVYRYYGHVTVPKAPNSKAKSKEVDHEFAESEDDGFNAAPASPVQEPDMEPQPESGLPDAALEDAYIGNTGAALARAQLAALAAGRIVCSRKPVAQSRAVAASGSVALAAVLLLGLRLLEVPCPTWERISAAAGEAEDPDDHELFRAAPLGRRPPVAIGLQRQQMNIKTVGDVLHYKSAYYGTLQVGTPAVPFTFVFDTGSGHLIVPSSYCHSKTCKAHKRYRRSSSQSAVDIDYDGSVVNPTDPRDQITIQFGTGEISGVFIEDVVCMEESALKVPLPPPDEANKNGLRPGCMSMRFIAATDMSEEPFESFNFDGVLGLGLDGLSQTPAFNFMDVLAGPARDLGAPLPKTFAVFLADSSNEESELAVGGWDEDHLQGGLYWNKVLHPELGHWMIKVKSIRVDGETIDFCMDGTCRAVVDTGTSLMAIPSKSFAPLYERMKHPAPVDGLCRSSTGPKLHFELEHFTITMEPEDYARPEWYKKARTDIQWPAEIGDVPEGFEPTRRDMYCRPMLMSMDMPEPVGPKLFILGEPVLRKYYTVYDSDAKRVGIGRAVHKPQVHVTQADDEDADDAWFFDTDLEEDEQD